MTHLSGGTPSVCRNASESSTSWRWPAGSSASSQTCRSPVTADDHAVPHHASQLIFAHVQLTREGGLIGAHKPAKYLIDHVGPERLGQIALQHTFDE